MIKVVYIPNPIHPELKYNYEIEATNLGEIIIQLLPKLPKQNVKGFIQRKMGIFINDIPIENPDDKTPVKDGDTITFAQGQGIEAIATVIIAAVAAIIGEGIAATVIGYVITAALLIAVAYALSALLGAMFKADSGDLDGAPSSKNSPTYSWDGAALNLKPGVSMGVLYGEMRIAGTLIHEFISGSDTLQFRNMVVALCEGEVEAIGGIEVNGQPYSNFTGVVYTTRMGTNDQALLDGCENTYVYYNVTPSAEILTVGTIYTTLQAADAISLKMHYMYGLYNVNSASGETVSYSCQYRISYKLHTDSVYTVYATYTDTAAVRASYNIFRDVVFPARGIYDIKIERLTATDTGYQKSRLFIFAVETVDYQPHTFPNTALLMVNALASEQLSGGQPNLSALVKGKIIRVPELQIGGVTQTFMECYFDGVTYRRWLDGVACTFTGNYVDQYSSNPIWCIYDLLTNERYGGGRAVDVSVLDSDHYYDQGAYCDTLTSILVHGTVESATATGMVSVEGILLDTHVGKRVVVTKAGGGTTTCYFESLTGTDTVVCSDGWTDGTPSANDTYYLADKKYTLNYMLDSQMELWEAIGTMALACCGLPVWVNGEIRIVIDKPDNPIQEFTLGTMVEKTFNIRYLPWSEKLNGVQVAYYDKDNHYSRNELYFTDIISRDTDDEPDRDKKFTLYGITEPWRAWKMAAYFVKGARFRRKAVSFATSMYGLTCTIGDVIQVAHDAPAWGQSGHVIACTNNSITISDAVTIEAGFTYKVKVQIPNVSGGWDLVEKTLTNAAGLHTVLTFAAAFTTLPYTSSGGKISPYIVYKTVTTASLFRIIEINSQKDGIVQITGLEHRDDIFDDTDLDCPTVEYSEGPNPFYAAHVENLALAEGGKLLGDGTWFPWIEVSWTWPARESARIAPVTKANVYMKVGSDGSYFLIGQATGASNRMIVPGVVVGQTYYIKIQSISNYGTVSDFSTSPESYLIIDGKIDTPADPLNFTVIQIVDTVRFSWDPVDETDLHSYVIREGITWDTSILVVDGIRGNVYETKDFTAGTKLYLLRSKDNSGNLSDEVATFAIELTDPVDRGRLGSYSLIAYNEYNLAPNELLNLYVGNAFTDYTTYQQNSGTLTVDTIKGNILIGDACGKCTLLDDVSGMSEAGIETTSYITVDSFKYLRVAFFGRKLSGDISGYLKVKCYDSTNGLLDTITSTPVSLSDVNYYEYLSLIIGAEDSIETDRFPVGTAKIIVSFILTQPSIESGDCIGYIDYPQIRSLNHNGYLDWVRLADTATWALRPVTIDKFDNGDVYSTVSPVDWDIPVDSTVGVLITDVIDFTRLLTYLLTVNIQMLHEFIGTDDTSIAVYCRTSNDDVTWSAWELFVNGKFTCRYIQFKIEMSSTDDEDYLMLYEAMLQLYKFEYKTDISGLTIAAGGTTLTYASYGLEFFNVPTVIPSVVNSDGTKQAVVDSVTNSATVVKIHVYDNANPPVSVGGVVNVHIEGV